MNKKYLKDLLLRFQLNSVIKLALTSLSFLYSMKALSSVHQSQNLENFSIISANKDVLFQAKSDEKAFVSGLSSIITSNDVNIDLKKLSANKEWLNNFNYQCDLFTLDLTYLLLAR